MRQRFRRALRMFMIVLAVLILLFLLYELLFRRVVMSHSFASGLYKQGAYSSAEKIWKGFLDNDDGDPIPESSLGKLSFRQNDFQKADKYLSDALPERERDATLHYDKGNSSYRLNDLDDALEQYKEAILLDPGDQDAKANYELVLRRKGYEPPPPPQQEEQPEEEIKPNYNNTLEALDQKEASDRQQSQRQNPPAVKDKWW